MAESMAIFFTKATWAELTAVLNRIAQRRGESDSWYFPSCSDYSVLVYEDTYSEYDDIDEDYEGATIIDRLDGVPSVTLILELRRSKGGVACDHASCLTTQLLECFDGLADTLYGPAGTGLWTLEEITKRAQQDGQGFLDCYRVQSRRRNP